MGLDDDKNVLKHLLNLETEAAALVDDAQAEADRRLSESEKQCRLIHDQDYSAEAERLEAAYLEEVEKVREEYQKQLDLYRDELMAKPVNRAAFSALAGQFMGRR